MATMQQAKTYAVKQVANRVAGVLARTSDEGIIRMLRAVKRLAPAEFHQHQLTALIDLFQQKHPALTLMRRLLTETSPACRRALINNLLINGTYVGWPTREKREAAGLAGPFFVVISPSMRCNLHCTGCYAWEYSKDNELSTELVDRIITEAKELGMYFFTISGGEPFVRKDLFDIWEKHNDAAFLVYTNGTLLDKPTVKRLAELGNVSPAISVEGFKAETDLRRGEGTWEKINTAMDNLREAGVIFGFSGTVTSLNAEAISSEAMVDYLVDKGCSYGWYFMYVPIGREPNMALMATPEQRQMCRKRVWRWRNEKPIFVADFWNDGHLTCGCMAGGRIYLHVTASGDVEPCVFCHFTVDNIRDKSLAEVLESDFFRALRRRYPWTDNYLTPCALIDNPQVLREAVAEGKARPSHPGAETVITKLAPDLDQYAARMHELTDDEGTKLLSLADMLEQYVQAKH